MGCWRRRGRPRALAGVACYLEQTRGAPPQICPFIWPGPLSMRQHFSTTTMAPRLSLLRPALRARGLVVRPSRRMYATKPPNPTVHHPYLSRGRS